MVSPENTSRTEGDGVETTLAIGSKDSFLSLALAFVVRVHGLLWVGYPLVDTVQVGTVEDDTS